MSELSPSYTETVANLVDLGTVSRRHDSVTNAAQMWNIDSLISSPRNDRIFGVRLNGTLSSRQSTSVSCEFHQDLRYLRRAKLRHTAGTFWTVCHCDFMEECIRSSIWESMHDNQWCHCSLRHDPKDWFLFIRLWSVDGFFEFGVHCDPQNNLNYPLNFIWRIFYQ